MEPLKPCALHPERRFASETRMEIECSSYGQKGQTDSFPHFVNEYFLARTTESYHHDASAGPLDIVGKFVALGRCNPAKCRRFLASDDQTGRARTKIFCKTVEDFPSATKQKDRQTFPRGGRTNFQHQGRTVHTVGQSRVVQPVQGPSNGLAVRRNEIQTIQSRAMIGVEYPRHYAVHGKGCNSQGARDLCRVNNLGHSRLVVHGVKKDAQNVAFAEMQHRASKSTNFKQLAIITL